MESILGLVHCLTAVDVSKTLPYGNKDANTALTFCNNTLSYTLPEVKTIAQIREYYKSISLHQLCQLDQFANSHVDDVSSDIIENEITC